MVTTWEQIFEISGDTPSYPKRIKIATDLYNGGGSGGSSANGTTATCGSNTGVNADGCINPLSDPAWTPSRTDQGIDYQPEKPLPVFAICDGKILATAGPGWPGGYFILIKLTNGPFVGKCTYVSEHLSNVLPVGTQVRAGQQIATALPGNPWSEWGWAAGPQTPSKRYDGDPDGTQEAGGKAFARFLKTLGAKVQQDPGPGPLYAGNSCQ